MGLRWWLESFVAQRIQSSDSILDSIPVAKSVDEIGEMLKELDQQVDLVSKAFTEQQKAIAAVTEGKRGLRAVTRYLQAAQQEDAL